MIVQVIQIHAVPYFELIVLYNEDKMITDTIVPIHQKK